MFDASFTGRYDADDCGAVGNFVFNGGDVKLRASMSIDTLVKGPSFNGLTLSIEKPGFFNIVYDLPLKDVRFQLMNTVRVSNKPLCLNCTHLWGMNWTALDGTLALDPSHKVWANYAIESRNCRVKYSYVHGRATTFEPCYDFGKNSWDVAVPQRIYDHSVVRASYQSSTKVLGLVWMTYSSSKRGFKFLHPSI